MLRAAAEGFEEGWATAVENGHPDPAPGTAGILAVTVLTSDPGASTELVGRRASLAAMCGCLGVVCAASDLRAVAERGPGLVTAVPGIRLAGSSRDDQARVAGPSFAIGEGADLLVIGRTVTASPSPEQAASQLSYEVLSALAPNPATGEA
jgi:orotidine-5'-phosphate decarboxylase